MGELYRCVEERIRVKVHIRTFKGLRGVCSGFVVAFDKFWNMVSFLAGGSLRPRRPDVAVRSLVLTSPRQAMVDVDETYREPLLGEAFYHEKALTISRVGPFSDVYMKYTTYSATVQKSQSNSVF